MFSSSLNMILFALITLIAIFILLKYFIGIYNASYWKKRGVIFYEKHKVFGVFWDFLLRDRPLFEWFHELNLKYPYAPAVAFGTMLNPSLYVKDPRNIFHLTQTDFQSFNMRGLLINEKDKLAHNVLLLHGPKWKLLRQKMTPLFTTAKLKNMYYIVDRSAQDFVDFLKNNPEKMKGDMNYSINAYSCAAISAAVFGIGTESTFKSPFLDVIRRVLLPPSWSNLKYAISVLTPGLFDRLRLSLFSVNEEFFIDAIREVTMKRVKEGIDKHDFVDICVSLQKNGTMKDGDTGFELEPTDEVMAAQAFFFYVAGLDPCSSGLFGTLFELGRNPDILKRLQKEIDETFVKCNGQLTYNAVSEMAYLDNIMNESLRIYPPAAFITRECNRDTVLPVGDIKVEKGTNLFISIFDLHHDPQYFPNPEVFDPERFVRDREKITKDGVFKPFGFGNRYCIGMRYAQIQMKAGIVHLLRNFDVVSVMNKGGPMYHKKQFILRLKNVSFEIVPRK